MNPKIKTMNKFEHVTTQSDSPSQRIANEIRQQFLGAEENGDTPTSDFRVILYSHDTMGIGHMRRNLLIASAIKRQFPNASILTIAGAKEACTFAQTAGIDCLTLPSYQKRADGSYGSRSLEIPAVDVLKIRSQTIKEAIKGYRPDLLIVDKLPAGAGGELLPALEWLTQCSTCRCVLGLRDILDTAGQVVLDWQKSHSFEIIRQYFQAVWIYGDRNVYDAVKEYQFPADIFERTTYTGYLNTQSRLLDLPPTTSIPDEPFVFCTVGGGQDGEALSLKFVEAMRATGRNSVLLTGPYMPADARRTVHEQAKSVPRLRVLEFVEEGDRLVSAASHVVSMGGYNTLSAILSHQKPALIVPRITPRTEQSIRANRLAEMGYVQTINPNGLSSDQIATWLNETSANSIQPASPIDMRGLQCICEQIHVEFPAVKFSKQSESA